MTPLEEAVKKILEGEQDDPWTELCIETIRLGAALARFDNARERYVKTTKGSHMG